MKLKYFTHAAAASVVALSLSSAASLSAQESRLEVATAAGARSDNPPAPEVQDEAARQAAEKRREIIQDAVDALRETQNALKALEQNRNPDALMALANATGKLELVLARDPRLALAPVDVGFRIVDVYTSPDTVKETVSRAADLLEEGMVQSARSLVSDLASELIISVTNLPLATYPEAIKAVTPMIDAGKIAEAKNALQIALGTLVVVDTIVPLPPMRAEILLEDAEMMAEKTNRTADESKRLTEHLSAARAQLQLGEALGYGDRGAFADFYKELDEIEAKTAGGGAGKGLFDRIKNSISRVFD
jgi:hypothetical protein